MTSTSPLAPSRAAAPGPFWLCLCGDPLSSHGRAKVPSGGGAERFGGCRNLRCRCVEWQAADGSGWPENGPAGVPWAGALAAVKVKHGG